MTPATNAASMFFPPTIFFDFCVVVALDKCIVIISMTIVSPIKNTFSYFEILLLFWQRYKRGGAKHLKNSAEICCNSRFWISYFFFLLYHITSSL